jgi:16S rRNA (cytidine1402-2'-O)-methyltransferase
LKYFTDHPPRGEFTLVVEGSTNQYERWTKERLDSELQVLLTSGESASQAAAWLAGSSGWSRREIYTHLLEKQGKMGKQ